jgi:hypothetical protein
LDWQRRERFSRALRDYVDRDAGKERRRDGSASLFLAKRIGAFAWLTENLDSRAENIDNLNAGNAESGIKSELGPTANEPMSCRRSRPEEKCHPARMPARESSSPGRSRINGTIMEMMFDHCAELCRRCGDECLRHAEHCAHRRICAEYCLDVGCVLQPDR